MAWSGLLRRVLLPYCLLKARLDGVAEREKLVRVEYCVDLERDC